MNIAKQLAQKIQTFDESENGAETEVAPIARGAVERPVTPHCERGLWIVAIATGDTEFVQCAVATPIFVQLEYSAGIISAAGKGRSIERTVFRLDQSRTWHAAIATDASKTAQKSEAAAILT